MSKKTILCTVTTDLSFDQRMMRICTSLSKNYNVVLVGRIKSNSTELVEKPYKQKRISCLFEKGKLFYVEYNIRLFFYLLFAKYDCISSIDLDTILPGYLVAKLRGKKHTYDAHEYFTEMEEVVRRPAIRKLWKSIERFTVPSIPYGYTVSEGYAQLFREEYDVDYKIVRNATVLQDKSPVKHEGYILYQGAVNEGRGLQELIEAMHFIDYKLVVCGMGDYYERLVQLVKDRELQSKVEFRGYVQPKDLIKITEKATIGITIFSNRGLSNEHSLANRFFDYFHNFVPQVAMNYPEYSKFNEKFKVAELLDEVSPQAISISINKLLKSESLLNEMRENCAKARAAFNWQEEEKTLLAVYSDLFSE